MATRKKKSDVIDIDNGATVVKGSHLTVTTYPNGRTELKWDDQALENDVRAAIATANIQGETNGKTRKTRKSK